MTGTGMGGPGDPPVGRYNVALYQAGPPGVNEGICRGLAAARRASLFAHPEQGRRALARGAADDGG